MFWLNWTSYCIKPASDQASVVTIWVGSPHIGQWSIVIPKLLLLYFLQLEADIMLKHYRSFHNGASSRTDPFTRKTCGFRYPLADKFQPITEKQEWDWPIRVMWCWRANRTTDCFLPFGHMFNLDLKLTRAILDRQSVLGPLTLKLDLLALFWTFIPKVGPTRKILDF